MSTNNNHCPTPVTRWECNGRHQGSIRWWIAVIGLFATSLSISCFACVEAWAASRDIAVHKAVQEKVTERVLASLERIETELRALRDGDK